MSVYDLVVAKNGPKLRTSDPNREAKSNNRAESEPGVSHLGGNGSIEQLVAALSARLDAPVRNLSGLTGGT
jgi:uncharacterized protein (TIGR03435 family)